MKRLAVSGFAHHPYQRGGSRPPAEPPQAAGEITISSPSRLRRVLDQAARRGRIRRGLPVFYTEFGFQTNPPDRIFGVRATLQPAYINQSDWMAYRDPRVRAVAQYKLIDEASLASFQSGLRFIDGRAKPAYDAYRLPIWVSGRGSRLRVYGQVRPAPDSTPQTVLIQVRPPRGGAFQTVRSRHRALALRAVPGARAGAAGRVAAGLGLADLARGAGRAAMTGRAVLATAALLLMAAPAHAASNLEVGMEDERLLLSEPVHAETAIAGMAAAGVDVVRIHARWIEVSPGRDARAAPARLRPRQPPLRALRLGRRSTAPSTSRGRPGCG